MEPVKNLSLRSFFILTVSAVFGVVVLLSGLVVWGCMACRAYLLPDPEAVYLTVRNVYPDGTENTQSWRMGFGEEETSLPRLSAVEVDANGTEEEKVLQQDLSDTKYSVEKITRSFDTLTPRRKVAYQCCGIAMVVIPGVLSLSGILIGGVFFYRKKLDRPLCLLQEAAGQIADQNLDFSLEYDCRDEMGELCHSFEQMRAALEENNQQMWNLLEQRRFLQASIAHDLRNPLAILQGYTEYLQMNLPGGKLSTEKISRIASHLHVTAGRLAQYTESVRILNRLEDMEVKLEEVTAGEFFGELADDLGMLASGTGKLLCVGGARLGADAGLNFPYRKTVFYPGRSYGLTGIWYGGSWRMWWRMPCILHGPGSMWTGRRTVPGCVLWCRMTALASRRRCWRGREITFCPPGGKTAIWAWDLPSAGFLPGNMEGVWKCGTEAVCLGKRWRGMRILGKPPWKSRGLW